MPLTPENRPLNDRERQVLRALRTQTWCDGAGLSLLTGQPWGALIPGVQRLEASELVASRWCPDEAAGGERRTRQYALTRRGHQACRTLEPPMPGRPLPEAPWL